MINESEVSADFWPRLKVVLKKNNVIGLLLPYVRAAQKELQNAKRDRKLARLARRYPTISRGEFLNDLASAVTHGTGYAAGKIGASNQVWMQYEMVLKSQPNPEQLAEFEGRLAFHGLRQMGIFPADPAF